MDDVRPALTDHPPPPAWPAVPTSWFYAARLADVARRPRRVVVGDRAIAVFRADSGAVHALDAQCVHMAADLAGGCVVGETLQCPFHEWRFDGGGRCVKIPASPTVPGFARQAAYPTAVVGGHVFVFNAPRPTFAMPFFDDLSPADLKAARPFVMDVAIDWWMVAANGFDLQHFRSAHDRTLVGEPVVDTPSPLARRITATFDVTGRGLRDRLTKRFSGPRVTMAVTSWCGTLVLVAARFRRTTSYGMVSVTPTAPGRSRLRVIVWVPRSRGRVGRALFDPADAAVRRSFIRAFVRSDQERSVGIQYNPQSMIDADTTLVDYFTWLAAAVRPGGTGTRKGN